MSDEWHMLDDIKLARAEFESMTVGDPRMGGTPNNFLRCLLALDGTPARWYAVARIYRFGERMYVARKIVIVVPQ